MVAMALIHSLFGTLRLSRRLCRIGQPLGPMFASHAHFRPNHLRKRRDALGEGINAQYRSLGVGAYDGVFDPPNRAQPS